MSDRIASRIDDWSTRPVSDGHRGLHQLADDSFTGAIDASALDITVVMLNGRVIGVFGGALDTLEGAALTAYEAPHPALPLLWVMRADAGSPRAQYYTEETPLSEVDDTLSSGGFTGFIELSENVLSGDYYQLYYGGRSLSVAFVGQAEQVLTDEEAFNRAADEVGIYEVYDASVSVQELPERPPDPEPTAESEPRSMASGDSPDASSTDETTSAPDTTPTAESPSSPTSGANSGLSAPDPSADVPVDGVEVTTSTDAVAPSAVSDAEYDQLQAERDELQTTVTELRQTNAELRERIAELEARLEAAPTADPPDTELTPQSALAQTNLFVRYDSKGEPTLGDVLHDPVDRMELEANLRLEHSTQFDAANATVGGEPFRAFLEGTLEFRFAEWLLQTLVHEIKETNNEDGLRDLYRLIPEIDRIQFYGEVTLGSNDTETEAGSMPFDVIARGQMGDPLLVATIETSNDPVTEPTIADLHESTAAAVRSHPSIGAAFAVTASFFEPEALQATAELTGSGLLSFDARRSHVKVTRTEGYHLCLVEVRGQRHHLAVPEL
ncbi:MAG: hypothetical protein ACLFR6_05595 [Salinarchaeum sp.]